MAVSSRNTHRAGLTAIAVLSLVLPASAGCGSGCTGTPALPGSGPAMPGLQFPAAPAIGLPQTGVSGPSCCGSAPAIALPGAVIAQPDGVTGGGLSHGQSWSSAGFSMSEDSRAASSRFVGGGGGFSESAGAPSSRIRLGVQTERYLDTVTETVPVTEQVCVAASSQQGARVIDAVCIDDQGGTVAAQRLAPGDELSSRHTGEVFRCLIGTRMQARIGSATGTGHVNFSNAETLSCKAGETVVLQAGRAFACAPHPSDCNCDETTVVKVYGPGAKRLSAAEPASACTPVSRTTMQTVTRSVERERIVPGQPMVLTGGVGSGVN